VHERVLGEHLADGATEGTGAFAVDDTQLAEACARGFVEAQGGRIWAENRPGGGAKVSFTLPAAST